MPRYLNADELEVRLRAEQASYDPGGVAYRKLADVLNLVRSLDVTEQVPPTDYQVRDDALYSAAKLRQGTEFDAFDVTADARVFENYLRDVDPNLAAAENALMEPGEQ